MAEALAFDAVTKRYRSGVLAMDRATWSVEKGAHTCLLGPNGAGKSTAIRLLQGALSPTSGTVSLLGAEVGTPAYLASRRLTGVVPQGPGMYADVTAGEYLELVRRLYRARRPAAIIEAFGLADHLQRRMSHLSGGFQRRLVLAAALLGEPQVLLLDEPTVGLDPVAADEIHAFLREACQGRTVLLCTHNLAEAESLCEEVVILRDGRPLVQGRMDELRKGAGPRLRLAARQGASALVAALRRRHLSALVDADGAGVLLGTINAAEEAPALLRALLAEGLDVYECRAVDVSLKDVFRDAVGAA